MERIIALIDADQSMLAAHSACLRLPHTCALFHVCVQYDVTKERIVALIDADRSMLQTLAEGVGTDAPEAAVAASDLDSSYCLPFKLPRDNTLKSTATPAQRSQHTKRFMSSSCCLQALPDSRVFGCCPPPPPYRDHAPMPTCCMSYSRTPSGPW
jgi:hypothetical protein